MNDFPHLLKSVIGGHNLSADDAARAIGGFMDETISPVRTAALLAALAAKGETAEEIVGAARAMRERAIHVEHGLPLVIDIVGTGGDGAHTINISTAAALLVAGCGIPVAKHGNRAASSLCGSADVLEALGVKIEQDPDVSARLLREARIAFLFARRYHPAFRAVGPVRTELGGDAAAVVHSASGIDEIAGEGPTYVAQFDGAGDLKRWTLHPETYGVHAPLDAIRGGDAAFNASVLLAILAGEASPRADLVVLNAALALVVAGVAEDIDDGMEQARAAIASGSARGALDALRAEGLKEIAS